MRWNCRVPVGMHGGVRGRLSICENILFDCGIRQALQNLPNICIDADGLPLNFLRTNRLPLVDADVGGVWVLGCHLPERVFDDNGGVMFIAHHFFGDHLRLMFWQHSGLHK